MFSQPLRSNICLFWLHYSAFQLQCHNINIESPQLGCCGLFTIKKLTTGKSFHVGENHCKVCYKILLKDISPIIMAGNMASLI
jgi:hypothetical protein